VWRGLEDFGGGRREIFWVGGGSTADPNPPLKYRGVRAVPPHGSRAPKRCYHRF
ncbi:unnamed protein product, partial [Musa textilis]